jgi:ubiquitin-protein ligase
MSLSPRGIKRVMREITELNNSKDNLIENGIYFHHDDNDITVIHALIVGTSDTPYEDGYYFFKIHFKGDYPLEPPKVYYHTQGMNIRFNPNLYVANHESGGKVCLSMINTWSGPGWVPTLTIINVLMAIQALVLIDEPLRNEPGYTDSNNQQIIDSYSNVIRFCNMETAILGMIKSIPKGFEYFQDIIEEHFLKNSEKNLHKIEASIPEKKYNLGKVNTPCYNFVMNVNYKSLYDEFNDTISFLKSKANHKKDLIIKNEIKTEIKTEI